MVSWINSCILPVKYPCPLAVSIVMSCNRVWNACHSDAGDAKVVSRSAREYSSVTVYIASQECADWSVPLTSQLLALIKSCDAARSCQSPADACLLFLFFLLICVRIARCESFHCWGLPREESFLSDRSNAALWVRILSC